MGNAAFINAAGLSGSAFQPVIDGTNAFERVVEYAGCLPGVDKIFVLAPPGFSSPGNCTLLTEDQWNVEQLLKAFHTCMKESSHLFYMYGDCPLLDIQTAESMYSNHKKYFAQYTFADGYPYGLTPEILKTDVIPALMKLAADDTAPIDRGSLFTLIQKDINAFDIETLLSPEDFRLLRVSLTCDTRRNTMQTAGIIQAGGRNAESVMDLLRGRQDLLRTVPSFVNVQIIDGCPQECSYCPFPLIGTDILSNRNEMPLQRFTEILNQTSALCGEATIGLGLWGEPALHSGITAMVENLMAVRGIDLLIETSGIGWTQETLHEISRIIGNDQDALERIWWIVSLDALDPELYRNLRGDGMRDAYSTVGVLRGLFPGRVWVQAVRMKSSEDNMESFYREWKKENNQVIIQKYDYFCGFLPERKVTDLSPVKRFPCWHMKRDVSVLIDGSVPLCREDLRGEYMLGNIFTDGLEKIWENGTQIYTEHLQGRYNGLCEVCDEYYTYNF